MSNEQKIWSFLMEKIGNACGVAGLMGNLYAESALRPNNLQNTYETKLGYTDEGYTEAVDSGQYANFAKDSAGYGLAQWTYHTRKAALLAFVQSCGASIGDLEAQLNFLWKELSESYKTTLSVLKTAETVKVASDRVLTDFERPADMSDAVKTKRAGYGQTYYDKYADYTGSSSTTEKEETDMGCTASKVIAVAVAEIGYKEKASNSQLDTPSANSGSANYTKYARDFDTLYPNWYNGKKNGFAWCDMFVDWCFLTAFGYEKALSLLCQPEKSAGAGCTYSAGYYKAKGQFYTSDPKPGDQIFFGTSISNCTHTGIVEKADGSKVYTIEGNTSDQVARRSYALNDSKIVGYGRPKYDAETTTSPAPEKTVEELAKEVLDGKWGNGEDRKKALTAAGYNYTAVQNKVNELVADGNASDPGYTEYTVVKGDTLSGIAAKYGTTYQKLAEYNGISNPNVINVGQKIKIPNTGTSAAAWTPKKGDIVNFTGTKHYASANATTAKTCKPGKAKISLDPYQLGKSKHPYHLIAVSGGGSDVYGWVDADSFTKA
ncbi:MAG: phage tail tip lysozyme [Paludibacteraceae bacterium]